MERLDMLAKATPAEVTRLCIGRVCCGSDAGPAATITEVDVVQASQPVLEPVEVEKLSPREASDAETEEERRLRLEDLEVEEAASDVVLRMVVQNLRWAAVSADPKLLTAFEGAVRRAVAVEADNGIQAEDVSLSYSFPDPKFVLLCVVTVPRGMSARAVWLELSRSRSLGRTITEAVKALDCAGEVPFRDVRFTEAAVEVGTAKPQLTPAGRPVPPHLCGVSKAQCAELLRRVRQDATWKRSNSVRELVTDFVVPATRGSGRAYALCMNSEAPKEVNVMVSHSWSANAEEFLECICRSTTEDDVLFICALSLYQAEDDAGPAVAEQLGPSHADGPFQKVLEHIRARGREAAWSWRCSGLVRALPLLPLTLALLLFYGPIVYWGCVPDFDMTRCAERVRPQAGEEAGREEWAWLLRYERDLEQVPRTAHTVRPLFYAILAFLAILAALAWWSSRRWRLYSGRLLVVPSRESALCSRLWCLAHILAARAAGVPVVWARTLATAGRCSLSDATCHNPSDKERLLSEIEERSGLSKASSVIRRVVRWRRWSLGCVVSRWVALATVLRCAELRLAAGGDVWDVTADEPGLALFGLIGAFVGTLLWTLAVYGLARRSGGRPRWWAMGLCCLLLLGLGAGTMALLVYLQVLRRVAVGAWTDVVPLLSTEGAAYLNVGKCQEKFCQQAVSITTSLAQSLLAGGLGLAVLLPGALCCSSSLARRRRLAAMLAASALLVAACTALFLEAFRDAPASSVSAGASPPLSKRWFPVLVLRLTQLLARCVVPAGAIWAGAAQWGVGLGVGRRPPGLAASKQEVGPAARPADDTPKSKSTVDLASLDERV